MYLVAKISIALIFCNACTKALQWLWQEDNLKVELEDMQEELKSMQGEEAKTLRDALTSRSVRWQILTLALPCSGIQFSGINAVCSAPWGHGQQHVWCQQCLLLLCLAVFLCFWHLPWVRRARGPNATPGLRYRGNGGNSCSSVCKCLLKWTKEYKRLGGTSVWSSMESHRALLLDPFKECCSWDQKQWYQW